LFALGARALLDGALLDGALLDFAIDGALLHLAIDQGYLANAHAIGSVISRKGARRRRRQRGRRLTGCRRRSIRPAGVDNRRTDEFWVGS